jgi:hypothetical protein
MDRLELPSDPSLARAVIESQIKHSELSLGSGQLGKFFGSSTNAPTNIAGIIVLLLTTSCIAALFVPSNIPALEFLKLVLPVITGILGYLFGKSTKE